MIEIDPTILKENLPEDIHRVIDQVNANVDAAVNEIVTRFRNHANEVADRFEKRAFDAEMQAKLNQVTSGLQEDLIRADQLAANVRRTANEALEKARAANNTALTGVIETLGSQCDDLTKKLADFREKMNSFAEKSAGLVAKTAIKAVTGGIG